MFTLKVKVICALNHHTMRMWQWRYGSTPSLTSSLEAEEWLTTIRHFWLWQNATSNNWIVDQSVHGLRYPVFTGKCIRSIMTQLYGKLEESSLHQRRWAGKTQLMYLWMNQIPLDRNQLMHYRDASWRLICGFSERNYVCWSYILKVFHGFTMSL